MTFLEKDSLNGYNNQTGTILRKMFQNVFEIYISDVLHSLMNQGYALCFTSENAYKNAFSMYIKEKKENEIELANLLLSITF